MAAAPQLLDVNSGLPANTSTSRSAAEVPHTTYSVTETGGKEETSQAVANVRGSTSQVTSQSQQNFTPTSLAALESLISSLTERPAISKEQLEQKAPLVTAVYSPSGWQWYDPISGRYMGQGEAQTLNNMRKAEQQRLIQQAGTIPAGTQEQQRAQAERQTEIQRSRTQQGQYSKEAAMADSQALINKAVADALRQAEPGITLASEGAGTSKSTFRAQALQEAATRGGIEGAALGANLSSAYGQIFNQLESTLEQLTRVDPNGPAGMLIQALQVAKGAVQNTTGSTSGSTSQQQTTSTTTKGAPTTTRQTVQNVPMQPIQGLAPPIAPAAAAQPTNPYYAFSTSPPQAPVNQAPASGTITSAVSEPVAVPELSASEQVLEDLTEGYETYSDEP